MYKMHQKMYVVIICYFSSNGFLEITADDEDRIDIVDMTRSTNWKDLFDYYNAVEKRWKMCVNCGFPDLGTAMHLEHSASMGSMHPAVIPPEYLLTRLIIIDVTAHTARQDDFVLTLDVALQWAAMKHDPHEPTLLLFKFGWKDENYMYRIRSCVCKIPGISYELAEWISSNLTHVVGVATDAPTLESAQTREFSIRTISNLLGNNGIYMIENVNIAEKIPEHGCMAVSMPLKLLNTNYVPTRLTAFCPTSKTNKNVVVALRKTDIKRVSNGRVYDVNMDELMNIGS